jgi:hypothetical protein
VDVELPMSLHVHPMPDNHAIQAAMYGPLVLAGKLGSQGLTEASFYPGYDTAPREEETATPQIDNRSTDATAWIEPEKSSALSFRLAGQTEKTAMVPLYKVEKERYVVYWNVKGGGRREEEES